MMSRKWVKPTSIGLFLFLLLVIVCFSSGVESYDLNDEVRSSLSGQFEELSDGVVHYEIEGSRQTPVVVLVHGFSVPYYVWDPTVETLLDQGYRVLRYDLYGRGYSDRPVVLYDLDTFVRQLDDLLEHVEKEGRVHLVGLSMDAPIAAALPIDTRIES